MKETRPFEEDWLQDYSKSECEGCRALSEVIRISDTRFWNQVRIAHAQQAEAREAICGKDARIARLEPLAKFALACLQEAREFLGDLDGGWIQDEAVRCGVLVETTVTGPCGEGCQCDDFPTTCYRFSDDVRAALAEQEPPK